MTIIVCTTLPSLARHTPLGSRPTGWVHHQHMYEQGRNRSPPSFTTPRSCQFDVLDAPLTTVQRGGRGGGGQEYQELPWRAILVIKTWRLHFMALANLTEVVKHSTVMMPGSQSDTSPPPTSLLLSPLKLVWKLAASFSFAWRTLRAWPNFYDVIDEMRWRTRLLFFYYNIIYSFFPCLIFTAPWRGKWEGGVLAALICH